MTDNSKNLQVEITYQIGLLKISRNSKFSLKEGRRSITEYQTVVFKEDDVWYPKLKRNNCIQKTNSPGKIKKFRKMRMNMTFRNNIFICLRIFTCLHVCVIYVYIYIYIYYI